MTEPPTLVEFLFIAIYNIAILELIIRLLRIVLCIFLIKCGIIILKMQIDESFCVNCTSASQVTISDFDYILSICWEATNVKYQGISGKYAKNKCKTNMQDKYLQNMQNFKVNCKYCCLSENMVYFSGKMSLKINLT